MAEAFPDPASSGAAEPRKWLRGTSGLAVAVAVVALLLIWLPAYRWFFLISAAIGVAVAAILYLWHKYRPVTEDQVENKKPLGLE